MRRALFVLAALWVAGCSTQVEPTREPEQRAASLAPEEVARLNARLLAPEPQRPEALGALVAVEARAALELALPEEALAALASRDARAAAQACRRATSPWTRAPRPPSP